MINHKMIAKVYGVPINYKRSPLNYFNWDGSQVNAKGLPEHDILHEIAHYIMSPKKYRKYVNFNLGYGPDESPFLYDNMMKQTNPNKPLARKEAQEEEDLTCALEFIFAALYQRLDTIKNTMANRQYMLKTNNQFNWMSKNDPLNILSNICKLQRKRLVDKNWVPTALKKNKLINNKNLKNLENFKKEILNPV